MTEPKEKGQLLSVGAKTYIRGLAKQHVYGYTTTVSTKEMQKGLTVENESIALLNEVFFTNYTKNTKRYENDYIGGTPDIVKDKVIDIKSSWSLNTFPGTPDEAYEKLYEWQLRGYMMLTGINTATLAYCMVDTPDELIGYEDEAAHRVSHIDPALRITMLMFARDQALEAKIMQKVQYAQLYFAEAVGAIKSAHA